jgi:hypothetical protein
MLVLGVDPGISGALAFFDPTVKHDGKPYRLEAFDMPTTGLDDDNHVNALALFDQVSLYRPGLCLIERVIAMPSVRPLKSNPNDPEGGAGVGERVPMPPALAMRLGQSFECVRTVTVCCRVPYARVTSQVWRRESGLTKAGREAAQVSAKEQSRQRAREVFPEYADALFSLRKHEARAEASLIARYGAWKLGLVPPINPERLRQAVLAI